MRFAPAPLLATLALLCACGDDALVESPSTSGGGGAGGGSATCPADAIVTDDGACAFGGVAPADCPDGFEPQDHGCTPLLPSEPCPSGLMALPGETTCRAVADCGAAPWGNIPLEPAALYVDQSYQSGSSDGSEGAPFTTIQAALDVVAPGAMIAIAEGDYDDALIFTRGASARLWGRCPELVTISAPGSFDSIYVNEDGTELHTLSFTGAAFGVLVESARGVLLDRLWIHDTADLGILLSGANAQAEVTIVDSLIERTTAESITGIAVDFTLERSAVREGIAGLGAGGRGIDVQSDAMWGPGSASVNRSIIERVGQVGLSSFGSDVEVSESVIRDVMPTPGSSIHGVGISMQRLGTFEGSLKLSRSLVERTHLLGVSVLDSSAVIEHSTIRDTMPQLSDGRFGDGVAVSASTLGASASITSSAIQNSARAGVASFSGAVQAARLSLSCNLIDLDGEPISGPFDFDDLGGNVCYCGDERSDCKVLTSGLEPPSGL